MKAWLLILFTVTLCTFIAPIVQGAEVLGGLDKTATSAGVKDTAASPQAVVGRVLQQGIALVGIIFFILILWAGFLWMTAGGSDERISEAKNILLAAVIGLIIVASAYAITKFVGSTLLTGNSAL